MLKVWHSEMGIRAVARHVPRHTVQFVLSKTWQQACAEFSPNVALEWLAVLV